MPATFRLHPTYKVSPIGLDCRANNEIIASPCKYCENQHQDKNRPPCNTCQTISSLQPKTEQSYEHKKGYKYNCYEKHIESVQAQCLEAGIQHDYKEEVKRLYDNGLSAKAI